MKITQWRWHTKQSKSWWQVIYMLEMTGAICYLLCTSLVQYKLWEYIPHSLVRNISLFCYIADRSSKEAAFVFFLVLAWPVFPIIETFLILQPNVPVCFYSQIHETIFTWNCPSSGKGRWGTLGNPEVSIRKIYNWKEKQMSSSNSKALLLLPTSCGGAGGTLEVLFLSHLPKIALDSEVWF